MRAWLIALVVAMVAGRARADDGFVYDPGAAADHESQPLPPDQDAVATAYLELSVAELHSAPDQVRQVACHELVQDLVKSHRFYYCITGFLRNAVDAGPFDQGGVIAWDGHTALTHDGHADPMTNQHDVIGIRFVSLEAHEAAKDMPPRTIPDRAGEALTTAFGAELQRRIAKLGAQPQLPARLPDWLMTALAIHFDTGSLTWSPGLSSDDRIGPSTDGGPPGADPEAKQVAAASAKGWSGTARFARGLETEFVLVVFNPRAAAHALFTAYVAADHFVHPR